MAKEIAEEYASSLADLTMNSKPLINMLTILAEENVDHAGVIVETVEKHLEKVHPEIKLPVLYLVDSIIKNVGVAYTQKFSASIVNMFTRTFKQVDEKTRAQMFKLRETWHDVFPPTKLYQLDVKVNLIDPAWPIQAQPQQSNIHVNPNFLKKPSATSAAPAPAPPTADVTDEKHMKTILAKKEQELLMLKRKKIEMELEQTRRQLEMAEKNVLKTVPIPAAPVVGFPAMPVAPVLPAGVAPGPMLAPGMAPAVGPMLMGPDGNHVPAKQRLGPPVNSPKGMGRIAPASTAMVAAARRDPRLARAAPAPAPAPHIAPNVFDIKPLERVTKRKNVITIDVQPELAEPRRDPRRQPRRDPRREDGRRRRREGDRKRGDKEAAGIDGNNFDIAEPKPVDAEDIVAKLQLPDPKKINKLPPIPKINRDDKKEETVPSPTKKRKETARDRKQKKRDEINSDSPSPDKRKAMRDRKAKKAMEVDEKPDDEMVAFKELKNYHKERYRRNRGASESPEPPSATTNAEPIAEVKDVDLRVLPGVEVKPASVNQKRTSTETIEGKSKKSKIDKFDILFGNEDVDLRQLPQVDEPSKSDTRTESPKAHSPKASPTSESPKINENEESPASPEPEGSPKKDWHDVKDKEEKKKTPTKLDLVRAKLAEATKGKDRLGRPLMFSKSPSLERERKNSSLDDTDLRSEPEDEVNKETISLIVSQAKEHFQDGKMDKNQYNTLMFQVMQLNEKLKLKEAKQKESLELSKRKLRAQGTVPSPKGSPGHNRYGDIDERVPPSFVDTPPNSQDVGKQDSDMRMSREYDPCDVKPGLPRPPVVPRFVGQYQPQPAWRGARPRGDDFMMRRPRPQGPYFRHRGPRPPYEGRFGMSQPKLGMYQGDSPIPMYLPCSMPPPLGTPGTFIPPTDFRALEYIDQDPMKTIEIDGIPREIRFYDDTAVIMLDWDDPREIRFLPGSRRLNFENKDSVVLTFNEGYKQVEFDDEIYNIKLGAPTRELFINNRWYECFFGAPPSLILIEGKTKKIQLEGPPPQVDIGKMKRVDLCAGKINLIVDAQHMFPIFLDSKVQKFSINGEHYTIRFVDGLRTVLLNEQPFLVEFGGLPRPIFIDDRKHFIRFSVLPRHVMPGYSNIYNMEGTVLSPDMKQEMKPSNDVVVNNRVTKMEVDEPKSPRPEVVASPDNDSQGGLDILASVMPSSMAPASSFSGYSLAEPLFTKPENIPGLDTQKKEVKEEAEEKKDGVLNLPGLGSLNVNDLFAKLVATGIVPGISQGPKEKEEDPALKEDKSKIHNVDLLNPKSLRVKQPGVVSKLYGGMQCSGCGARFPPEQTTRYSAHLDWHFRQNRRARDSARRAHSRHWHYDLADWVRYEEVEDAEDREKSWFETSAEPTARPPSPDAPPSVKAGAPVDQHCALCGDRFPQYYHEDHEEWHLRGAVRKEDKNYHPLCWEDYQASLAKDEPTPMDETTDEVATEEKLEDSVQIISPPPAEVAEVDDESDVELVDDDEKEPEPVVEDLEEMEEDDDVVLKAEPVEQVLVEDDYDTDDETRAERAKRDQDYDFSRVKVKIEPVDPDDEPEITAEEEGMKANPDTTLATVQSSLDGNMELEARAVAPPPVAIRINISKPMPVLTDDKNLEDISSSVSDEPPPPGEEEPPELEYELKETMRGAKFSRQPPLQRGKELSGLCSIM